MNFLAHQYLSFNSAPVMAGNFMADSLRGRTDPSLPAGVLLGVEVHRFIDTFTDSHELVLEVRKLLYPHFSKYASVVQDVFFDHFLAATWSRYHEEPLTHFVSRVYHILHGFSHLLNEKASRTLHHMSAYNWLEGYAHREGVHMALSGLSRRALFASNMENSLPALDAHYDELRQVFEVFFPELHTAVDSRFAKAVAELS